MTTKRILRLIAAVLWTALTTPSLAICSSQQSAETVAPMALSTPAGNQQVSPAWLQETASVAISGPFANPFVAIGPSTTNEGRDPADGEAAAVPAAYPPPSPAPPASSSNWAPTHFEIWGSAQWRNLSS